MNATAINLLGTNIDQLSMQDVLATVDDHIRTREPLLLGVVNVAKLVNARRDGELRKSLEEADIVVADGLPVVWLSRLCGKSLPGRVAGIDIMMRVLEQGDARGYKVFFLGARDSVVEKVVSYTHEHFPGVRVAGFNNGYFDEAAEETVAGKIRQSGADVLFVAMTSPKKENFLRRWSDFMQVPVCHGVGGSFDVVAGVTKRAPKWMQNTGLEWLYRVLQEPRRMWKRYLVTNSAFVWLAIREVLRHRFSFRTSKGV